MNTISMPTASPAADWLFFFIMVVAIGLPIVAFLVWIAFFRKRKHRRRSKHRRQRREHHPLNPTLAETGGLPPARPPEPPTVTPSQTP